MLSFITVIVCCILSRSESVQAVLPLKIQLSRRDWDSTNRFDPATFLCLSQVQDLNFDVICRGLFYVHWIEPRGYCFVCWCWWNCWPSLIRGYCFMCWCWWNCWPSLIRGFCFVCWCWWNCWPSLIRGYCFVCWCWWYCWPSLIRGYCFVCWCWWYCWPSLIRGYCFVCWCWWNCWPSLF